MAPIAEGLMNRRAAIKRIAMGGALAAGPLPLWATAPSGAAGGELLPLKRFVIGHRGACAYAPENTLPSYRLAIRQGVEYVEQDLQITRDGVLVCCHDLLLNRITNVADVYPDRFKEEVVKGEKVKRWYIHDFTLKEIRQLDAGSWFDPKFRDVKLPTWSEAIEEIKGKAGLCPETKGPGYYGKLGFNMEALVVRALKEHGLGKARAAASTPVFIQSFSRPGLKRLAIDYEVKWPLLWLTFVNTKWTPAMFDEAAEFAAAIGPYKRDINSTLVEQAPARRLRVVGYTFRAGDENGFQDVGAEMRHYLETLGIDAVFTDNPDQFPR